MQGTQDSGCTPAAGVLRPRGSRLRTSQWIAPLAGLGALLLAVTATHAIDPARRLAPPRVLIVGGGPSLQYNQVAIESNVRYVGKCLPRDASRITLFADGDPNNATVLYDDPANAPPGERVFNLIMSGSDTAEDGGKYRKPRLGAHLDGASRKPELRKAFSQIAADAQDPSRPLLLYFTGHGSRNGLDLENNQYDLWGGKDGLTVKELAREMARLPEQTPVTLVMVQCFSGSFGNLMFENGDPHGEPLKRDFAGFFATVKERVAAGCTSAVNEAEYHDFTSYFFAALTGRDRVGRRITGADYNGDGHVGMNEAYCYTLVHDESIDVPVCTSDVFLRRYGTIRDSDLFQAPYTQVLSWADPAQHAALEQLSTALNKRGDDRLSVSYERMVREMSGVPEWRNSYREVSQRFDTLRKEAKRALLSRWPELRRPGSEDYKLAQRDAIAQIGREIADGKWKEIVAASEALDKADLEGEAQEIAASRNLRFVRLGKSVILAHWLKEHGAPDVKARFARLIADEARSPFEMDDAGDRTDAMAGPAARMPSRSKSASSRRAETCCTWDQSVPLYDAPRATR